MVMKTQMTGDEYGEKVDKVIASTERGGECGERNVYDDDSQAIVEGPDGADGIGWHEYAGTPEDMFQALISQAGSGDRLTLPLPPEGGPWEQHVPLEKWVQLLEICGAALVRVACHIQSGRLVANVRSGLLKTVLDRLRCEPGEVDVMFYAACRQGTCTRFIEGSLGGVDIDMFEPPEESRVRITFRERSLNDAQ